MTADWSVIFSVGDDLAGYLRCSTCGRLEECATALVAFPVRHAECNSAGAAIESLSLSARAYNTLKRHNVHGVDQLRRLWEDGGLRQMRNLGERTFREIEAALTGKPAEALPPQEPYVPRIHLRSSNGRASCGMEPEPGRIRLTDRVEDITCKLCLRRTGGP